MSGDTIPIHVQQFTKLTTDHPPSDIHTSPRISLLNSQLANTWFTLFAGNGTLLSGDLPTGELFGVQLGLEAGVGDGLLFVGLRPMLKLIEPLLIRRGGDSLKSPSRTENMMQRKRTVIHPMKLLLTGQCQCNNIIIKIIIYWGTLQIVLLPAIAGNFKF